MSALLVIKSSLFGSNGQSSQLVDTFVTNWHQANPDGRIIERDLNADPVPHLSAETFGGFQLPANERSPAQQVATALSDRLIDELKTADAVVVGLPMYNFTIPSTFKSWMDHIARAGVSFQYGANGPEGLVGQKPVTVIFARGGKYRGTEADTQTGLLRTFFGFLGLQDIRFVYAEGFAMGENGAARAQADAREAMLKLSA